MQTKLSDALKKLLGGIKASTPDTEVATALAKFCKSYGNDVVVERHGRNASTPSEKRSFLILFESNNEAVQFSYEISRAPHGHEGVIIEVN